MFIIFLNMFLILFIIGFVITLIFTKLKGFKLFLPNLLVSCICSIVLTGLCLIFTSYGVRDFEYLHGKVIDKEKQKVSCEHRYVCGEECDTDDDGKQTCSPVYCPVHSYDVDWIVISDLKNIKIDRVDSQGLDMPAEWKNAQINDAVTIKKSFSNPILYQLDQSPFSYPPVEQKFENLPNYPKIYNYYKLNPLVDMTENSHTQINDFIINWEKDNSKIKKTNIIVVLTNETNDEYFNALLNKWKSVKKNDIILIYGLDKDDNIIWFNGTSYAKGMNNIFMFEKLKTNTYNKQFNIKHVSNQLTIINEYFNRVSDERFSAMKLEASRPSNLVIFIICLIMIVVDTTIKYFLNQEN